MIVFEKGDLRISLITPRLLRTEKGVFTDLPTQTVQNRDFCKIGYNLYDREKTIIISTEAASFSVNKKNGDVLEVYLEDCKKCVTDFKTAKLPGTARTLDRANGAVKLEKGITSLSGASVMDDSRSLLITELSGSP